MAELTPTIALPNISLNTLQTVNVFSWPNGVKLNVVVISTIGQPASDTPKQYWG